MLGTHIAGPRTEPAAPGIGEGAARIVSAVFFSAAVLSLSIATARADWLNGTGAETAPNFVEFDIRDDRVVVALEIDFSDYPSFVPEVAEPIAPNTEPDAEDLSRATGTTFEVEANGSALAPQIRTVEIRDRKPRPTAGPAAFAPPPRGARVIAVTLEFPFSGKPGALIFTPPRDDNGLAAVTLGFLAYHKGLAVTDYRYLSQSERLVLDWNDPWYSAFENPNLTRQHRAALMSFVSIEPRETRHEIVFRLRDLEEWTDLDFGAGERLDAARRASVVQAAERFFAGLEPVVRDGRERRPQVVRVVFLDAGASGLRVADADEILTRVTAILGAVLSYPHRTLPQRLEVTWQLFTERVQEVPVSITGPAGPVAGRLTPDAPKITWTNGLETWKDPAIVPVRVEGGLPIPVLSILLFAVAAAFVVEASRRRQRGWWAALATVAGLAGLVAIQGPALTLRLPGGPDEKEAAKIAEAIMRNATVAMFETEQESFDRALERFVVHKDIEPVGAEMQRGLSVQLPSGARALTDRIEDVRVEEVKPSKDGVTVLAVWTAHVSAFHWGRRDVRQIDYRASIDLAEGDRVWRLCGLTVFSARPTPGVRPDELATRKDPSGPNL